MDEDFERKRLAFGTAASLYDRARPSYPLEAVRWLLGDRPFRVLDLGAGTGILTRLLRSAGHEVVALDPDETMLAVLASRSSGVETVVGQAESIPLPDASFDAAVAAQAHWWFDSSGAYVEIARVLRPGGVFGALWNGPDPAVPWAAELNAIESGGAGGQVAEPSLGPEFGPRERARFAHSTPETTETLLELIRSRAYFIAAGPEQQAQIEGEIRRLASRLPQRFELPYVTYCCRAMRVAGP